VKLQIRLSGTDGSKHYAEGDEYDGDSEWARRMLINGLALPLDDAALKIAASAHQIERYGSRALVDRALELGVPKENIPAHDVVRAGRQAAKPK
jgi:hypothetical protein